MRSVKALACVFAVIVTVACDCLVPVSPTAITPPTDTPSSPTPPTTPTTLVSLSVQGATSLRVGDTTPWQAVAQFSDGSQRTVTANSNWTSSSPGVAAVNSGGVVTGVTTGQATIQAAYDGQSASGVITIVSSAVVPPTVSSLSVEGNTSIRIGESSPLQAIARMSDGSSQTVTALATWSSDSPAIASVSVGTVLGVAAGQVPIRASYGGRSASATVTVSAPTPEAPTVIGLTISGTTSIQVGQTTQLQATAQFSNGTSQNVTATAAWTSSATNVATVSGGLVSGQAAGTAPIQAAYQGRVASAGVIVTSPSTPPPTVNSLSIQGTTTVQVGQTTQLQATAHLSDGTSQVVTGTATWNSASTGIATVAAGLVTGQSAGTSNVTASHGGKSAQVTVTVTAAPPSKILTGIEVTATVDLTQVLLNQLIEIHVYGVYNDGSKQDVTSLAVISPDNVNIHHDTPGTLNVAFTLVDALLDPNHVVNVQYGGFTEAVNIVLKLPVVQSLQLGTGGLTSLQIGSQLPAVQGLFSGGASASLVADFPGLTWSLQPRGLLGTVLGLLGLNLNQVLTVTNGRITVLNNTLLNQVIGLAGSALPIDIRATYSGITSNVLQANVSQ